MKKYLIIFFLIFLIVLLINWLTGRDFGEISITTDKAEYEAGGILIVKIKNNFWKSICFSSCYPYLLERLQDGKWGSYQYTECYDFNGNGDCVEAKKEKVFELTLFSVEKGLHRLVLPVCINCKNEKTFREDRKFYSNEFEIKEKINN